LSKQLIVFLIMQILIIIPKIKSFKKDLLNQINKDVTASNESLKTNSIKRIFFISIICAISYGLAILSFSYSLGYSAYQPIDYIGWNIPIDNFLDVKIYKYLSMLIDEFFLIYAIRCFISMAYVIRIFIKAKTK